MARTRELVHVALRRRVYTQSHVDYVGEVIAATAAPPRGSRASASSASLSGCGTSRPSSSRWGDGEMTMDCGDVCQVVDTWEAAGIDVWIDGGWGVDALLGEQTREHDDLDVVVGVDDLPALVVVLARAGFTKLIPWPDSPETFIVSDERDRRVDVHPVRFDAGGNAVQRIVHGEWTFPAAGLLGTGTIGARRVHCLTAEVQVLCHAGYELDDDDRRDMQVLHDRFGVELLPEQRAGSVPRNRASETT